MLYTLKEGGILTSFDRTTGEIVKQARVQGALGAYFSSPVAADGKIYAVSEDGKAAVIRAGAQWEILAVNDLGDGAGPRPLSPMDACTCAPTGRSIVSRSHLPQTSAANSCLVADVRIRCRSAC